MVIVASWKLCLLVCKRKKLKQLVCYPFNSFTRRKSHGGKGWWIHSCTLTCIMKLYILNMPNFFMPVTPPINWFFFKETVLGLHSILKRVCNLFRLWLFANNMHIACSTLIHCIITTICSSTEVRDMQKPSEGNTVKLRSVWMGVATRSWIWNQILKHDIIILPLHQIPWN